MTRIVLLDAFTADQGDPAAWAGLDELGQVERHDRTATQDLLQRCAGATAVITNKVPLGAEDFAALPDLRYVGVTATGFNIIDVEAAKAHGVAVTNVPAYSAPSVAQMTIALLLELASAPAAHAQRVADGDWARSPDFCFLDRPIIELAGKTVVVIGYGDIGQSVGRIAEALGMRVIAAQIPGRPAAADRMPLAAALPQADVISLHCPLSDLTNGLVGADFLAQCRDGVILLNSGRGQLIDEPALAQWLDAHPAARCGQDVLAAEPPPADHPLVGHPQVLITPHIAWATAEARGRLRGVAVDNLRAWLAGESRNRVD